MAIPKIPPILTEADWNKNKGVVAKLGGETGIGALIKDMTLAYNVVKWDKFDVQKTLKPSDSADRAAEALAQAQLQFKKVPVLVRKIEALQKRAEETRAKFAKNVFIPASSTQHVGKLAAAAKMFSGQVQMVEAEFEAFEKVWGVKSKQEPTVKEVIGEKWFADLAKVAIHKDPNLMRWAVNADVANSALGGPSRELLNEQARVRIALDDIKSGLELLAAYRDKRMKRELIAPTICEIWDGIQGPWNSIRRSPRSYKDQQTKTLGGAPKFEQWGKANPAVIQLIKKVEELMENTTRQFLVPLGKQLGKLSEHSYPWGS